MSAEMKALGAPPIIETFAINPVGDGDICVDRGNRFAHERDVAKLHAWAKEAADAIERLTRERDEAQTREIAAINDAAISNREHDLMRRERDGARATLAAADKGTPIYKAVDRVLDEHSAWIARPSEDVTKAIALAAGVAWMAAENIEPCLDEIDSALAEARSALAAAQAENARLISDDFRPGCRVSLRGDHPHVRWVNSTYGIRAGHQATVIESMSDERYVSVVFDGSREVADILKSLFLPARRAALSPGGCDARQSQAASDVLAERRRQIESEGWTPEHDDTHRRGEMATAAACYAVASQMASQIYAGNEDFCDPDALVRSGTPPWVWPWGEAWWKPRNRRVALIKAGALIIAEIERLDRAARYGGRADG